MKTISKENKKVVTSKNENVVFTRNENTAYSNSYKIFTSGIHKTVVNNNDKVLSENDKMVSSAKKMRVSRHKREMIFSQNLKSANSMYEDSESTDVRNAVYSDKRIVTRSEHKVNNHNILGNNEKVLVMMYVRNDVRGDGNCLFRCFSKCMYGHEERHFEIRTKIVDYVGNNWIIEGDRYFYKNAEQYINYMGTTFTYGTECEISIFVKLFKANVYLCQLKAETMLTKKRMTHFTSDDVTEILFACFDEDVIKKNLVIFYSVDHCREDTSRFWRK